MSVQPPKDSDRIPPEESNGTPLPAGDSAGSPDAAGDTSTEAASSDEPTDTPAGAASSDDSGDTPADAASSGDSTDTSADAASSDDSGDVPPASIADPADAANPADPPDPEAAASKSRPDAAPDPSDSSGPGAANANEDDAGEKDDEDEEEGDRPMTLRDHLRELRKRLGFIFILIFVGFCLCWNWAEPLFTFLMDPLYQAMPAARQELNFTHPTEAFFSYMKVAFVAGLFVTSPLIFWQIWSFVAPGLHKEEKVYLLPLSFFSALFFIAGAAFCYYISLPFVFDFLMSYNSDHIRSMLKMEDSLGFVLQLTVAFGVVFEMPLFVFFLSRMGLITARWMRRVRRYAVLVSVILAAVITPPDVMSQLLMAGPLLILYEFSILVAALFGKKAPEGEEEPSRPNLPFQGA